MDLSDEALLKELSGMGFTSFGDRCLICKFMRTLTRAGKESKNRGGNTPTARIKSGQKPYKPKSSFTRVRTVSEGTSLILQHSNDAETGVRNDSVYKNPLHDDMHRVDRTSSFNNPGLDVLDIEAQDRPRLRGKSSLDTPSAFSELHAIWIRFRWQLAIGLIVLLEGVWFGVLYRLYSSGEGSIFWFLRGLPGCCWYIIAFLQYRIACPKAQAENRRAKPVVIVLACFGIICVFLSYNSYPMANPIFSHDKSMRFFRVAIVGIFAAAFAIPMYLAYAYRKQLKLFHQGRVSRLFVLTACYWGILSVVFPMYNAIHLEVIDSVTRLRINSSFCAALFFVIGYLDTKTKARMGAEEFTRRFSGTYMYLLMTVFFSAQLIFSTAFKQLHVVSGNCWCMVAAGAW
jgi:hypothetical protein